MVVFFTTELYDCAVGVAGFGTDIVVLLFRDSSQIEYLRLDNWIDTTAGKDCDLRSNFSTAALALMLLLAGIPPLIIGYVWNSSRLNFIVESVCLFL